MLQQTIVLTLLHTRTRILSGSIPELDQRRCIGFLLPHKSPPPCSTLRQPSEFRTGKPCRVTGLSKTKGRARHSSRLEALEGSSSQLIPVAHPGSTDPGFLMSPWLPAWNSQSPCSLQSQVRIITTAPSHPSYQWLLLRKLEASKGLPCFHPPKILSHLNIN